MDLDRLRDDVSSEEPADNPRAPSGFLPLDRFNAFSDGVFAIAITLLVLGCQCPPQASPCCRHSPSIGTSGLAT